jgi:hypothetical protein
MIQKSDANLLQMVYALAAPRRFTRRLDCGQKHHDQDADDGDNHKQLDERECCATPKVCRRARGKGESSRSTLARLGPTQ